MFVFDRPVRFEDVDAAQIVFFPRVLAYCHEAMAEVLGVLEGGYAGLVVERRIGLPTVHVDVDFTAPVGFGDVARMTLGVARIGRSSCTFHIAVSRLRDGAEVARVKLICACSDLSTMRAIPLPPDVRAVLAEHAIRSSRGRRPGPRGPAPETRPPGRPRARAGAARRSRSRSRT